MLFPVIVADPPWSFTTWSDKAQKSAKRHYHTMSQWDIASLPLDGVAAEDCVLLLWATWPNLEDALTVGAAWGFEYATLGFIWVKRSRNSNGWHTGLGYYTRANSEPCLLFTRGHPQRVRMDVHQLIVTDDSVVPLPCFEEVLTAPVGEHSPKPEEFYLRVAALLEGPYLSLFERRNRPNWTMLGDEITGNDIREDLKQLAVAPELFCERSE